MSRISGLRNDMNKRTFYKERKIKINRCFNFLSKQNIIVPLILDTNENCEQNYKIRFASFQTLCIGQITPSTPGRCFSSQKGPLYGVSRESRVRIATLKELVAKNLGERILLIEIVIRLLAPLTDSILVSL